MKFVTTSTCVLLHALSGTLFFTTNGMDLKAACGHVRKRSADAIKILLPVASAKLSRNIRQDLDNLRDLIKGHQKDEHVVTDLESIQKQLGATLHNWYAGQPRHLLALIEQAHQEDLPQVAQQGQGVLQEIMKKSFAIWFMDDYLQHVAREPKSVSSLFNTQMKQKPLCTCVCISHSAEDPVSYNSWLGSDQVVAVIGDDVTKSRTLLTKNLAERMLSRVVLPQGTTVVANPYNQVIARVHNQNAVTLTNVVNDTVRSSKSIEAPKGYKIAGVSCVPHESKVMVTFSQGAATHCAMYAADTAIKKLWEAPGACELITSNVGRVGLLLDSAKVSDEYQVRVLKDFLTSRDERCCMMSRCKPSLCGDDRYVVYQPSTQEIALLDINQQITNTVCAVDHPIAYLRANRQATYLSAISPVQDNQRVMTLIDITDKKILAQHAIPATADIQFSRDGNRVKAVSQGTVFFYEIPREVTPSEALLLEYLHEHGMEKALDQSAMPVIRALVHTLW